MKKLILIIASLMVTGIFAQANENAVAETEAKAAPATQEAAPAPTQEDKNATAEEAPEKEK